MIALLPGPLGIREATNPVGVEAIEPLREPANVLFLLFFGTVLPASAASLIIRYRRGDIGQRQQIKWLAYAGSMFAIALPLGGLLFAFVGGWPGQLGANAVVLSAGAMPVAIGVAVMRYRAL
jgi:hypothetical protein